MSDPKVDRWKQRGRICVWKHKQRHVDWNLSADEVGCEALLALITLMETSRCPSRKTLSLVKPQNTATGVNGWGRASFASQFILKYPKSQVPETHWEIVEDGSIVTLAVGLSQLHRLRVAILDMKNGGGDYSIGSDQAPLWIWWFVE